MRITEVNKDVWPTEILNSKKASPAPIASTMNNGKLANTTPLLIHITMTFNKYQDVANHDLSLAEEEGEASEEFHDETLEDEIPSSRPPQQEEPQQEEPASKLSSALMLLLSILLWGLILAGIALLLARVLLSDNGTAPTVRIEVLQPGNGPPVTRDHRYRSMVTLYIDHVHNNTRIPAGWTTRKEDGAEFDDPFEFQPGVKLIRGWTEGVLQMREGERAFLHVPSVLGYGGQTKGSPDATTGAYIPAHSDLLFDIEILGKANETLV